MIHSNSLVVTTPSDSEVAFSRVFNAPRRLVYDAYTKCEYLRQWLGVIPGWSWDVCKIDLEVGGSYRYVWRNVSGMEMGMGGTYREIVTNERIVATEKFDEAWYEGEALDTTTFVEREGKTTLTIVVKYGSKKIRDSVLESGASEGMNAGFDNLDTLLASLSPMNKSGAHT
jgi:uncharacterized protein YndB with AHSA1/START domain